MENKSNSLNRIKRQQREKVLRFSIRKYSFGAASVAVAALMFLGAHVVSADVVDTKNQPAIGAPNPKEEESPRLEPAPIAKNEETEEREKPSENKEAVEANPLTNGTSTSTITVTKDASGDEVTEKQTLDKSQLQASITNVQELLDKVNKEKAPASTLAAIQADLETANSVLNNNSLELTQAEIDAIAKKLNEKIFVLSSMPKANAPEKVVKEGKNTIANTGSHDSRNGQSMAQGTNFRANGEINQGALTNIRYFASVDPGTNGGNPKKNDNPEFTRNKTDIKATYVKDSEGKWIVYDVYFNNDGHKMVERSYQQHYYFQGPFNIMDLTSEGGYKPNTVKDLSFTRYRNTGGKRLSDGGKGFTRYGNPAIISNPASQQRKIFDNDRDSFYDPNSGVTGNRNQQWEVFKHNQDEEDLNRLTKDKKGNYPRWSYYLGVDVHRESVEYAIHMHVKIKLRDDVTSEEVATYGRVYAASVTKGGTTNQSYIMGAMGTRLQNDPEAKLYPITGKEVTKEVGAPIENVENPVGSGFVTRDNGSKAFPDGMSWKWLNGQPNTNTAGVFNPQVKATYSDNTSNTTTATLIVKPKKPTITTSVVNKKGLTGQQITVNVGSGVKDNSIVKLYEGDRVIGRGTTHGETGTVIVQGALSGNPITAETLVNNGGEVTSVRSDAVRPTEAPDTQAPTLTVSKDQTVVEGKTVTFTVTAKDDKHVNLIVDDFTKKYGSRLVNSQVTTNYEKDTATEKILTINIKTTAQDVGKPNTITFNATDNANHSAEPVTFTFNVTPRDNQKPEATLNGVRLTENANTPIFTVYRGATFNPELKVWDNSGVISKVTTGNLPYGITASTFTSQTGKTEKTPYTTRLSSGTVVDTQTLGEHIGTLHVEGSSSSDSRDFKFKYRVVDIETKNVDENSIAKVSVASTLNKANSSKNIDAHNYLKVVDSQDKADRGNNYLPQGMTWTWKDRDGNQLDRGTTLDNSGKYTRTATAIFPAESPDGKFSTNPNSTRREVFAPAEIKRQVILAVTPTAPIVEGKENGSVTITPPTRPDSTNKQDIDTINLTYVPTGKTSPETVIVTKSGNTWTATVNGKATDKISVSPEGVVTISDAEVADKTEVTAKVSKNIDNVVLESPVAKAVAKDAIKPEATLNGVRLTENANTPIFTVYRGATFNPELKVWDNSGVISKVTTGNLPYGITASTFTSQTGKTEKTPYTTRLSSGTVVDTQTLGEHIGTLHVEGSSSSDSRDFKFKYRVVDIETKNVDENSIAKVSVASTLNKANSSKNIDAHNYLKVVDSQDKADRGNNYLPQGMTWTWKDRDGNQLDRGTTLDNSGKYTRTATAIFPAESPDGKFSTNPNSTRREVFAPAEIKRQVILAVTPTAPIVEGKENGSVTITPPTRPDSTNKQDIDTINLTYVPTGKTSPETVIVTKSGNTWTATVNGKATDKISVSPEGVVTISDAEVADKTEVTAKVSKNIDGVLTLESPVAIGTANGPLAAEVTNPAPVPEKAQITPVTVVTPNKPGSSITVDGKINGLTVDEEGKLKGTPEVNDWKPKEEEHKITIPVKVKHGDEIVTKDVPVTIQRDTDGDAIPDVKDPDDDNDGIPDEEEIKNGTDPKVPTTQTPTIGITRKENGDAIVTPTKPGGGTYPRGTTVTIPGNDNTPIEVTIGNDGSGTVPNDKLPKTDKPGTGTVTEPNKAPSKPVEVTTPARKKPTVALDQDPDTGEVTVTPKKPDGTLYPENTKVEIPGKDKDHPITITIGKDGKGKVPNSKLPEGKVPGTSKITVPGKPAVEVPNVTTPSKLIPTVALDQDPDTGEVTVTPKKPDGTLYPENTKVEIPGKDKDHPITITIGKDGKGKVPNSKLPEGKVPGTSKITVPGKPAVEVPNVTTPSKLIPTVALDQDPDTGEVTVTPKKPDGTLYPENTKVEIPGKDKDHPITITIGKDGKGKVPNSKLPEGKVPGTSKITVPGKPAVEVPNVTTPSKLIPTVALDQDPDTGEVTVTPKKPDGTLYPENTKVEIPGKDKDHPITITIGKDGKGKVPNSKLPEGKVPGTSKITVPGKPAVEVPNVTTPSKLIPTVALDQDPDTGEVTVTPKKPDGTLYPENTKVEIPGKDKDHPITITIGKDGKGKVPNSKLPEGKVPGTSKITVPGKPAVEVPNVTTPSKLIPTVALDQDPDTGEVTVTPKKPDGTLYPENTKVEIPGKDKDHPITITIGKDGKGKVPNSKLPEGKVPGTSKITVPGKPAVEVPNVTTPSKLIPTVALDQDPDTGEVTVTPKKPDGTLYPENTKVEIPGKDKDHPITITIGKDGKGKVPNSKLPEGKVPGTSKITVPGKPAVEVPNVTTPSKLIPTVALDQDPDTGEVTVTPKKPDGTLYPENTKVEIPGKDKDHPITITIGKDGKGKVPNSKLPEGKVPGTSKITVPGKPAVEVPNVTTPSKLIPTVALDQDPDTGEVTVTPKKPDGTLYPENTKVEIPGKDKDHPITITIGKDGKGKVPNSKLPEGKVPGTSKITVPGKPAVEVPNVTTPSKLIPTVALDQDPDTGEVTVTPKKPDGTLYPENTKVEIPGKDKDHPITITIGKDGKGKVPNSELPEGKVPGTSKITVPGKPAVEVPVETPGKIIPGAPTTEQPVAIEINQKPNGDAVVTPKKEDGKPYPPGTKVEIPGEDKGGNPITITVMIGDNGSGEVPNDNLPKKAVPGTGTVTEPKKNPSQPVPVTTPAHKKPKLELEQDPKTGDVTVTPKKPDGSTFPPKTKVEIPGENGPITVEIGQDGKGKVPNDKLPKKAVPGTGKITEPGKPTEEVPVETPAHKTPTLDVEQDPKTGDVTVTPKKPDGSPFPRGTKVEIPGKDKDHPITVTIGEDGKGKVPNSELPEGKVPGTGKITEPGRPTEEVPNVTTPAHKTPTLDVEQDPKTGDVTITPKKPDGSPFPSGTKVEIPGKDKDHPITVTIGEDGKGKVPNSELPEGKVPGTGKITEPGRPTEEVPNVTTPAHKTPTLDVEQDPKTGDVTVTPKKPDGSPFPSGTKVEIPGKDKDHPITVTIDEEGKGKVPNSELPEGKVPGKGKITEPGKPTEEVPVETPAHKTPTLDVEQDPKTGDVTVTPKKPDGSPFPRGTKVEIPGEEGPITVEIGQDGKGKVPNNKLPKKDVPGTAKITEPGKPAVEVPNVTTPAHKTPTLDVERDPKTGDVTVTPKRPDGSTYPPGTKVEIPGENGPITVEIGQDGKGKVPNGKLPKKDVPGTGKITEPGQPAVEVPNVTTPAHKTPTLDVERDPKTGDVTVTPKRPDGSTFPPGTTVEIPGENGPITVEIGQDGKGKVPNNKLPKKDVPGTGKITEPGKPAVEVPNVTTPGKFTPETPVTEQPGKIEITQQPNGNAIVTPKKPDGSTYPPGTKVEIPGENGTTITVTIGDNGSGEVPNDKLPKGNVPGKGTVTEPNKKPSQPVDVTTPARKTPTLDVEQDPKTGDVTVTPKKPDGSPFPRGTKVEIPGEEGPITVEIGQDGKGKVPNNKLPKKDVPGTAKITEPGKPAVEVPNVTTPAHKTPTLDVERDPKTGDVTVTPKRPDGSTYPPGTKVEIPGENGPITVEIGQDGKGKVPNNKLPKKDVPGTGKITEPGKPAVEVPNVTTPAHKTPTLDVERDPKTGDVTVTPKRPDGSTFPPGTTVEIPGENGPITVEIGQDGKGKVPNNKLPKKDVPGTGKITEPGKPAVEVPNVTTPGKFTPETPVTEQPGKIEITQQPNGNAIVTPKKPDGSTYPPGTKVEIPGENGTTITVTIGDNGSGEVPNDKLPKGNVPGKGTVTEPNKKPSQPVDVTTPARKTPTVELEQDPKTGDVIVTPKKPDGTPYESGTKVEIPGKDKDHPITVTIGEDGKGKVPNSELPDGKVPGTAKITEPGRPTEEVPVETPAHKTPTLDVEQNPKTGEVTVTPKRPDGTPYPPGTTVEIPGENGPITVEIGQDGKGKVPNNKLPKKDVPGTGKITESGQPAVEVPNVTTPGKFTPETPVTEQPGKIEITQQPNGNAIVTPKKPDGTTYPSGSKVEIPGEDGTTITVTIGDNGSGEVPNDKLPKKDVPGTGTVTEPNKKPSQPVDVTTPARKTPTLDVEQDPKTGDVTVTPKKPDGSTYPPGTKVEIPGKDGNSITVTIGEDGKGKVPNSELPDGKVPGTANITEPGQPAVEVPDVTTPAHKTPTLDVERDPKTGDVTVTPKRPDGSTFPPGTTVEIPGENGPITVEIGQDGKGKVPNNKLPKKDVPGTGKITEPGQPAVEVPNVTTPGKFTPETPVTEQPGKIEITQQPNGNAIVTPKKPDGTTYPSGSRVEIPGEDGTTITVTIGDNGSGEVPNDNLPKTNVPGTGTVTEPNKKPSQPVDVTTPARKTPTLDVKRDPETGDVTVTPKKPDGSIYPPGTVVEIPGKDGKPITVTIGEDGKGKVPNSDLPDVETPGTGKITEPGKPAVEVPNVTTPGKFTPSTPTPNTDQVDTKTTMDNGAKSNDSQNVLPNTGTESNAALASLGLLGLLSGFGLVARKKKED